MSRNMHALLDIGTHSLLVLNSYAPTIAFLAEAIPNSYVQFSVDKPTYKNDSFLTSLNPSDYPMWVWEADSGRRFLKAPPEIQTDDIRKRSELAVVKAGIANRLVTSISFMRAKISTGILFQEIVYLRKRDEAVRLRENGFSMENPTEFPYVVQYADYAGIGIKEAAETILFQASLDDQLLAKTETLRIRYFDRLKKAATPEEMNRIPDDFKRDTYFNGLV